MNVWRAALELARAGAPGVIATVARTHGSTPVPAGAKMLIGGDRRLIGTVGGGCVEADIIATALVAQRDRRPVLRTHHLNADLAGDLGLSCGGTVDIFVEPIVQAREYLGALEQAAVADAGIVSTAVSWEHGPRKTFAPVAPGADVVGPAATVSADGREVIERWQLPPRVIVFGAGHVGAAIANAAAAAGFRVVIVDDRPEFADPTRFSDQIQVRVAPAGSAVGSLNLSTGDAVVIATRGHRYDATILASVAASPAGYVGLLGSRRKQAVITKGLTAAGVAPEALARVRVPIGLAIGAVTPEEIAVSAVAELIAWRRKVTAPGREASRASPPRPDR